MRITTKEDFIKLYLATAEKDGQIVSTHHFKEELLKMMYDRKYEDLFTFFNSIEDLNFERELIIFEKEGYLKWQKKEEKITIHLSHTFQYSIACRILNQYDDHLIILMSQLLQELNLSSNLTNYFPDKVSSTYRLTNPNTIYQINENMRIITDGNVNPIAPKNFYLVQDANFVVLQTFVEGQVSELNLSYSFDNPGYIFSIIQNILDLDKEITTHMKMVHPEIIEARKNFVELEEVKGYRYRR